MAEETTIRPEPIVTSEAPRSQISTGDIAMLGDAFSGAAGAMRGMGGAPDYSQVLPGGTPIGQGGIGSA